MNTKDFTSYKGSYRKGVENIYKGLPDLWATSAFAFIVKAVD
jgi:hypothetical protein